MKAAWGRLNNLYPHIHTYGCVAHALNLLFSDIRKIDSIDNTIKKSAVIVKTIRKSQRLLALFNETEGVKGALKLPSKTRYVLVGYKEKFICTYVCIKFILNIYNFLRWASVVITLESILTNKKALKKLSISEEAADLIETNNWRQLLQSNTFWDKMDEMYNLLSRIKDAIAFCEGDSISQS